jgi:tetratricopeptide (TPR) repeat protein
MGLFGKREKEDWDESPVIEIKEYRPDDPNYLYENGVEDLEDGDLKGAISHLQRCLKIKPKHVDAHITLGRCFVEQGKLDKAMDEFLEAIHLDRKNYIARHYLGCVYERKGKLDKAITEWKEAAKSKAGFVSLFSLAAAYEKKGKVSEAIKSYESFLKIAPDVFPAYIDKAKKSLIKLKKKSKDR